MALSPPKPQNKLYGSYRAFGSEKWEKHSVSLTVIAAHTSFRSGFAPGTDEMLLHGASAYYLLPTLGVRLHRSSRAPEMLTVEPTLSA